MYGRFNFGHALFKSGMPRLSRGKMKRILVRITLAATSAALVVVSGFSANAATIQSQSLISSGGVATPAKICGYPDNPNRSCEWWPGVDGCYQIFQSNAPDWQKIACAAAGFSRK